MSKAVPVFCLVCLMLVGCGGGGGNSSDTNTSGNTTGSQSTAGAAQGVYSGTSSNGYSFSTIVLPNDKFYGIYGTMSGNTLLLYGMVTGQGTSSSSSYTANVSDFFYTGAINTGSLSASYVAGSRINGTLTEGNSQTFSGTALPASSFNYNTAASVSAVTGAWSGTLLDGSATSVTINSNGSFAGSSSGCPLSGTVTADSSGKNFFDVSVTFGNSNSCQFPNQTATGIAVEYLLSNGITHQLLAGVTVGTSLGTVFAAER